MTASNLTTLLAAALMASVLRCQAGEITLASVPRQVAKANPELTAARFMIEEARGRYLGSGRRMNPEIEVTGRRMTEGREGGFSVGLMQKFPVTARLRLEKAVTTAQIVAAEAEVADKQRILTAEAESMAVKILAMRAEISIAERQASLAEKLTEIATARAAANESAIDAAQMRLEARTQRNAIRRRQAGIAAMTEALKPMLGLSARTRWKSRDHCRRQAHRLRASPAMRALTFRQRCTGSTPRGSLWNWRKRGGCGGSWASASQSTIISTYDSKLEKSLPPDILLVVRY